MRPLILMTTVALAGCTSNAVNVEAEIHPDGTGSLTVMRLAAAERPGGPIRGLAVRDDFSIEIVSGPFQDVSKLDAGGIRYTLTKVGNGFRVVATVPTTAEAPWFRYLGHTAQQQAELERWVARQQKASDKPDETLEALAEPSVVLTLKMPGEVEGYRLVDRDLPAGWFLGANVKSQGARKATLRIPITALRSGKVGQVSWEVTCGPATRDGVQDWQKVQRRLAAAK